MCVPDLSRISVAGRRCYTQSPTAHTHKHHRIQHPIRGVLQTIWLAGRVPGRRPVRPQPNHNPLKKRRQKIDPEPEYHKKSGSEDRRPLAETRSLEKRCISIAKPEPSRNSLTNPSLSTLTHGTKKNPTACDCTEVRTRPSSDKRQVWSSEPPGRPCRAAALKYSSPSTARSQNALSSYGLKEQYSVLVGKTLL